MQANKKSACHPQSIVTLSTIFRDLQAGKQDAYMQSSPRKLLVDVDLEHNIRSCSINHDVSNP